MSDLQDDTLANEAYEGSVMDELPDEVLVDVFAYVASQGNALALLDVRPLVCQRWRGLVQDSRAWSTVDIKWNMDGPFTDNDALRLILHAPALRSPCIDLFQFLDKRDLEKFENALLRTKATVTFR